MLEEKNIVQGGSGPVYSRNNNLGILYQEESVKGLTHPFFSLIMNAFKDEAEKHGYDVSFLYHPLEETEESLQAHCIRRGIDGLVLLCGNFAHPKIKELVKSGLPCVSVDHIFKGIPAVLSDNETGVQRLVEYAISKGHERIAFVYGHNNSIVTRTRISQYKNTMAVHHLPVPEEYLRESMYHDIPLTRKLVLEMLRLPEPPTCILLPDDMTYLGAQEAARELGKRIPEDISFAGYDGIPLTQALAPRLTTIHQNSITMGKVAADRLIDLVEHPNTASRKPTIFPVELIEGQTVAGPGK